MQKIFFCALLLLVNVKSYSADSTSKSNGEYHKKSDAISIYPDSPSVKNLSKGSPAWNLIHEFRATSSDNVQRKTEILSALSKLGFTLGTDGKSFTSHMEAKYHNKDLKKRRSSVSSSPSESPAVTPLGSYRNPFSFDTKPASHSSRCVSTRSSPVNEDDADEQAAANNSDVTLLEMVSPSASASMTVTSPVISSGSESGSDAGATPLATLAFLNAQSKTNNSKN